MTVFSRFCGIIDGFLWQFLSSIGFYGYTGSLTIGGIIAVLAIAVRRNADPFIVRIFWSKIYLWYYK
jgi:UDP-N-acetylmuramyl pentapeptide phosphotransferase/UDP-N-acetylglucosamine-1-phosphate transferase